MVESLELKRVLEEFYSALGHGDKERLGGLVSSQAGVLGIGTDTAEWWEGSEVLQTKMQKQMEEMGHFELSGGAARAWEEGSVGWAADEVTLKMQDGTESALRVSAVFHKEEGKWKMVQFHVSVGVPNEYVVGKDLTT